LDHPRAQRRDVLIEILLETAFCRDLHFPAQGTQGAWRKTLVGIIQIPLPVLQIRIRAAWWSSSCVETKRLNDALETLEPWFMLVMRGPLQCAGCAFEPSKGVAQG
jgi:hypothetical protein